MKGSNTCVNKTDSKGGAGGGRGMKRVLLQGYKVGTLSINDILSHKAKCPCTCANQVVTTRTASMWDIPFETIEQSSLLTTRSNLVGRCTEKQRQRLTYNGKEPSLSNFV